MGNAQTKAERRLLQLCIGCTADISQFRELLRQGVDVNIFDKKGNHPLWYASHCDRDDLVLLFLEHKAAVDLPTNDKFGETALIATSTKGHMKCATILLKHRADINYQRKLQGATPLTQACTNGHLKMAVLLIDHGAAVDYVDTNGDTPLTFACRHGHASIVSLLLEKGGNINQGAFSPVYSASEGGHLAIVELLVNRGSRIDQPCDTQIAGTPLQIACSNNHPQVVSYLISKGARVNYQTKNKGLTSLHVASENGHRAVVQLLIEFQAKLDIKNNDGETPIDVARRKGHSEIMSLLERADHTSSAKNEESSSDVQAEGGKTSEASSEDGAAVSIPYRISEQTSTKETPREREASSNSTEAGSEDGAAVSIPDRTSEQTSTEETPREREASSNSTEMMIPIPKENYVCGAQSSNCLVYLSNEDVDKKFSIESVTDSNIHSQIASNEIELTPIVRITPDNMMVSLEKPAIIELLKNVELSAKEVKNQIIPLCAEIETSKWTELGSECNCKVCKDRISFEVTRFGLHAVISRKPYPSSTKTVKPSADISVPTELTISELPGFKVQVPPCSVNADRDVEITATMLYDSPTVCSEEDRSCLASSCIDLKPHGTTFSKNVSISIPIPDYAEVMENNPNAQLQVWHSDVVANKQWTLVDHSLCKDEDGRYIAVVKTNYLRTFITKFKDLFSRLKSPFKSYFNIKARCQVFMSQEKVIQSQLKFGIKVLYYPYKDEPESMPQKYKYELADSERLDIKVSKHDKIQFSVEFEPLLPCEPKNGLFDIDGRQQNAFPIQLDGNVILSGGLLMGKLSIGVKGGSKQTMILFMPNSNLKTTHQFEENIVGLEDSAERLGQDVIQYEESPGSIVEAVNKIASMGKKMAQLIRKEYVLKQEVFKDDIVDVAKNINKESREVTRIATVAAGACTESGLREAVHGVVDKTLTISHQLRILAQGETSRQRDEASDLEACKLLATNAKNLNMVISETMRYTHSACIKIDEATKRELGLTKIEAVSGMLHQVNGILDETNHRENVDPVTFVQDIGNIEETGPLCDDDHSSIYSKLKDEAANWRDIGKELGFREGEMNNIQSDPMLLTQSAPKSYLREMLSQWLQWAPGDGRRSTGYASKESLRAALLRANLGQLAQQFK